MRWSLVSADAIAWRDFDGDIVVRNAHTGSTHLLERFPAEILRLLLQAGGPVSVEDLEARLPQTGGNGESEQWLTAIEEVLKEFQRLGLAEAQS